MDCRYRGIIPPNILDQLARNGSAEQRTRALDHLALDASLRAQRLQTVPPFGVVRGIETLGADESVQRSIYNTDHSEVLPGRLVRSEGQLTGSDEAVDEAYEGLGATFALFHDVYGRNSIDDQGLPLKASVHFGEGYDNAFWNGSQMVFGDGDGDIFNRFTVSIDVIGHELAHGVTEDEAGLRYINQSGALNESMSDVFGSLVKQYKLGQTADQADWLIGAGLFSDKIKGVALRSMAEPGTAYDDPVIGKDPQPGHMKDYVDTTRDNGGVHTNSGIPNRAFYLAATSLGGHAWEVAGRVWYDALRDPRVTPTARFATFARATVRAARSGFGEDAAKSVQQAWEDVGVAVD